MKWKYFALYNIISLKAFDEDFMKWHQSSRAMNEAFAWQMTITAIFRTQIEKKIKNKQTSEKNSVVTVAPHHGSLEVKSEVIGLLSGQVI